MNPYAIPGLKGIKIPPGYFASKMGLTADVVVDCVCSVMEIHKSLIPKKTRKRNVVEARHFIGWFLVKKKGMTLSSVGKNVLGGRDHTTIINNIEAFQNLYDTDDMFRAKADLIIENLIAWTPKEIGLSR